MKETTKYQSDLELNVEYRGSGFELHFDILFPIFQNNIFACIFHQRTQIVHHGGGYLSFVLCFYQDLIKHGVRRLVTSKVRR
jgi:hypothetical protein